MPSTLNDQEHLTSLERIIFSRTPADFDGRKCRGFARKLAREVLDLIKQRVHQFTEEGLRAKD